LSVVGKSELDDSKMRYYLTICVCPLMFIIIPPQHYCDVLIVQIAKTIKYISTRSFEMTHNRIITENYGVKQNLLYLT